MTHDIETLTNILKVFLWVAAFFATSFPVLYMFSPWYSTNLGRLLMLQSVSFALAIDLTVLFTVWQPENILIYFWVQVFVFGFIAIATGLLTYGLWRTNHSRWGIRPSNEEEQS